MLELPEAHNIAKQLKIIHKKKIIEVIAGHTPNKFSWYSGKPSSYPGRLTNSIIKTARAVGGMVQIDTGKYSMVFSDGVNLRYHETCEKLPKKHQLLLRFDDDSALAASVQMYGGLLCEPVNKVSNKYYKIAASLPSPYSTSFSEKYFQKILSEEAHQKLSVKALLATEQRIPGLGNGCLQDILWQAKLNPRMKTADLSTPQKKSLYKAVVTVLKGIRDKRGRDTEKDLFGQAGRYKTVCSKNTAGKNCPKCGKKIRKESYMGGSVYYCTGCQKI